MDLRTVANRCVSETQYIFTSVLTFIATGRPRNRCFGSLFIRSLQTGSVAHPAPRSVGIGIGVLYSGEAAEAWSCPYLYQVLFWCASGYLRLSPTDDTGWLQSHIAVFTQLQHGTSSTNLMFFWPCIMNWLYINYQLDALIIIYS